MRTTFTAPDLGALSGRLGKGTGAVMLGALGLTACVGVPVTAHAQEAPNLSGDLSDVAEKAAELERNKAMMSPDELADARAELWSDYLRAGGNPENAADAVPVLGSLATEATTTEKTRGELRLDRLTRDIERAMRITARDVAHNNYEPIEGMPGYKEIDGEKVKDMIVDAIKDIPLSELPGGKSLAQLVTALPNSDHIDAENLSYNELMGELGDAQKDWFEQKFGPFLEKHKIEAGIVAFGAITAIRYTSPEIASMMDGMDIEVWDKDFMGGALRAEAALTYRDENIFPDVDLHTRYRKDLANDWSLRGDGYLTLSGESEDHVTGRVTGGVRKRLNEGTYLDLGGYGRSDGRYGTVFTAGHTDHDEGLFMRGRVGAHFGDGTAHGDADGRIRWELDLNKDLNLKNADGRFGVFVGGGVDTDGGNNDVRAGVMFTLRW